MSAFAEYVWLAAQLWWPAYAIMFGLVILPCMIGAAVESHARKPARLRPYAFAPYAQAERAAYLAEISRGRS